MGNLCLDQPSGQEESAYMGRRYEYGFICVSHGNGNAEFFFCCIVFGVLQGIEKVKES